MTWGINTYFVQWSWGVRAELIDVPDWPKLVGSGKFYVEKWKWSDVKITCWRLMNWNYELLILLKNDDWWPSIIMLLSCNLHDNYVSVVHVYRSSTEYFWAGMSSRVGSYMIPVYYVRIMMWPGQISSDLFRLKYRIFNWSGRRPLAMLHVAA